MVKYDYPKSNAQVKRVFMTGKEFMYCIKNKRNSHGILSVDQKKKIG